MRQFLETVNLNLSPDSLSRGEEAIRQELAIQLYKQEIFTFAQARRLADLSVWEFQQLLCKNKIQRRYNETDLSQDVNSIQTGIWDE